MNKILRALILLVVGVSELNAKSLLVINTGVFYLGGRWYNPCYDTCIENLIWNSEFSVSKLFSISSDGHFSFDQSSSLIVLTEIDLELSDYDCSFYTLVNLVYEKLRVLRIDPRNWDFQMIILPEQNFCAWDGLATLLCDNSLCTIIVNKLEIPIIVHEFGHSLGLLHASTPSDEYGDYSCFMGNANILTQFNTPYKYQLGWLNEINIISNPPVGSIIQLYTSSKPNNQDITLIMNHMFSTKHFLSYRTNDLSDKNLYLDFKFKIYYHTQVGKSKTILLDKFDILRPNIYNRFYIQNITQEYATVYVGKCDAKPSIIMSRYNIYITNKNCISSTMKIFLEQNSTYYMIPNQIINILNINNDNEILYVNDLTFNIDYAYQLVTPSPSRTSSVSRTPSITTSPSRTPSISVSVSVTSSRTSSRTPSKSPSMTRTPSRSPSNFLRKM